MPNFNIFTKLFAKLGYTLFSICDSRLITGDHQILIGCNTFLRAIRAYSRDVTAIKKVLKIFFLACKWSVIRLQCDSHAPNLIFDFFVYFVYKICDPA